MVWFRRAIQANILLLAGLQPATPLVTSSGSYRPMNWRIACTPVRAALRCSSPLGCLWPECIGSRGARRTCPAYQTRLTEPFVATSEVDDVSRTAKNQRATASDWHRGLPRVRAGAVSAANLVSMPPLLVPFGFVRIEP